MKVMNKVNPIMTAKRVMKTSVKLYSRHGAIQFSANQRRKRSMPLAFDWVEAVTEDLYGISCTPITVISTPTTKAMAVSMAKRVAPRRIKSPLVEVLLTFTTLTDA